MDLPFLFQLFYYAGVKANLLNSFFLVFVSSNGPCSTLRVYIAAARGREKKRNILMMIFFHLMDELYNSVAVFSHPVSLKFL